MSFYWIFFNLQTKGTSMGAAWAPEYACLHLGLWEEEDVFTLPQYLVHVKTWIRYIDDIFVIWTGDIASFHDFIDYLNINDRNIHLTYTVDRTLIPFLDLRIGLKEGRIVTSTFRNETAANTLLQADSHHPPCQKNSIPIGEFMRIKRNCSETSMYNTESK